MLFENAFPEKISISIVQIQRIPIYLVLNVFWYISRNTWWIEFIL